MSELIDTIYLEQGDTLINEGEESLQLFYVVSGLLTVHKRQGDTLAQVGTIYAGEVIGEMSFFSESPRFATVTAAEKCEILSLSTINLKKVKKSQPIWLNTLMATMIDRLSRNNARIKI